jgi:hypothetical protein
MRAFVAKFVPTRESSVSTGSLLAARSQGDTTGKKLPCSSYRLSPAHYAAAESDDPAAESAPPARPPSAK